MSTEVTLLLGVIIGGITAYITAKVTTGTQMRIASINAEKDITLQRNMLHEERTKNGLLIEREKLDLLHRTLSRIELENSQTMSYIQSDSNLGIEGFRLRYLDNCERLHEAMSIADIYYPKMSSKLRQIYAQSNIFWGNQENLLRTDISNNRQGWQSLLSKVLEASDTISKLTDQLKTEISDRAQELSSNNKL